MGKRRKHSKIDQLEPAVKETVDEMIKTGAYYREIVDYIQSHGVSISLAAVGKYAKNLMSTLDALRLSQENFRAIMEETDRYPDLDMTDGILRLLCNQMLDAINKLRDTASAHRRIILVEVMGRHSGWLAMMSGIAGGAEFILVPEVAYDLEEISIELQEMYDRGKRYSIIVVAEGAGSAIEIGKIISEKTEIDTRVSVLGHIQRGGSPTVEDRIKASMLGEKAALAVISGINDVVFSFNEGQVVSVNLFEAVNNKKTLDPELVRLSRVLA